MKAEFVISAATSRDFPQDGLFEVAMVGRSNVGKSSVINALLRERVARTSAHPGKTRLANVYRVARGAARPFYLVDLPGYGYARGGDTSAREFEELTRAYFGSDDGRVGQDERVGQVGRASRARQLGRVGPERHDALSVAALLLVDIRHPGLANDRAAWQWLHRVASQTAVVATKADKLARGQRIRAVQALESVFEVSVLPVSAVTGEGLDELWKLIDRLANSRTPLPRSSPSRAASPMAPRIPIPTAAKRRKK